MKAKIYPSKLTKNTICIPPSKSMAHRSIICASLADGISKISNVDYSKDIDATIEGMRKLGAIIDKYDNYLIIKGIENFSNAESMINCNESGSTIRFFIPIFSLCNKEIKLLGTKRLLQRPQSVYEDLFKKWNLNFIHNDEYIQIDSSIKGGYIELDGNISSQFITGLLFALPLLKVDSIIKIRPPFESFSYVDLTIEMLEKFGVKCRFVDDLTIEIKGNQKYLAHDEVVEADYSQLGFYAVLGTINSTLEATNLKHDSKQGDKAIIDIINNCNGLVSLTDKGYKFSKCKTLGNVIDLNNCPDLGPIVMVLCALSKGTSKIINAARLRIKESDRIQAMEDELRKLNVKINSTYDTVTIVGNDNYDGNVELFGHNDHRIVMALSILGTVVKDAVVIDDAQAISKSYPGFFEDLKSLGIKVDLYD